MGKVTGNVSAEAGKKRKKRKEVEMAGVDGQGIFKKIMAVTDVARNVPAMAAGKLISIYEKNRAKEIAKTAAKKKLKNKI